MIPINSIIEILCDVDDFCKELDKHVSNGLLEDKCKGGKRGSKCMLSESEIMTIMILFQMTKFRNFKTFYNGLLMTYWKSYFPKLPNYGRFIELMKHSNV